MVNAAPGGADDGSAESWDNAAMSGTYSNILLHVVFSTKNREPFITPDLRERLYPIVGGIVRDERGDLLTIGGMPDHVHLLVRWNTKTSVADLMRNVKARSSKWVHETYAHHARFAWQVGYGAFSVSASQKEHVRAYIEHQEEHHRRWTFKEEYLEFLRAHEIEFDERYVWD